MKNLIVIDMQNDFITGSLGTKEAVAIVPKAREFIKEWLNSKKGNIYFTRDTHKEGYLDTQEGKNLPVVHCLEGSEGWEICEELKGFSENAKIFDKPAFGCRALVQYIQETGAEPEEFVCIGLCTDICIISNAMLLKAFFPEIPVTVVADCCAGVTPESHQQALNAMQVCQVNIL